MKIVKKKLADQDAVKYSFSKYHSHLFDNLKILVVPIYQIPKCK